MRDTMETVGRTRDELARGGVAFREAADKIVPVTAKDRTGAVSVTIDGQGRISQILVSMGWKQSLSADSLTAAVNEATTTAAIERMNTWGTDVVDASERGLEQPTPLPADDIVARLSQAADADGSGTVERSMQAMRDLLRELVDSVDDVQREVREHLTREYAGRSGSGHASATVAGNGTLVDLAFDRSWLDSAHPNNIGREAVQAIHDAYQKASQQDVQTIIERSPLGRLQQLAAGSEGDQR